MIDPTKLKRGDLVITRQGDVARFIYAELNGWAPLKKRYCSIMYLDPDYGAYYADPATLDYHPLTELLLELSGKL